MHPNHLVVKPRLGSGAGVRSRGQEQGSGAGVRSKPRLQHVHSVISLAADRHLQNLEKKLRTKKGKAPAGLMSRARHSPQPSPCIP